MTAYYNEFDPNAAEWLRELISMGLIADGIVDDRSILDVEASDLKGFTQHHFFAGIGVWSYALRNAGWSDDTPICTASLPCQPFSAAGKRLGKADERHLLPHFLDLVSQCNFDVIIGEQVPGAIKQGWLDDLYDEMESQGYACGATVLTAAGAGSPHIRQRIYWAAQRMGNTGIQGLEGLSRHGNGICGQEREEAQQTRPVTETGGSGRLGYAQHNGQPTSEVGRSSRQSETEGRVLEPERSYSIEWLYCRDNKCRPIKSGIKPLVDGLARGVVYSSGSSISPNETIEARVMRLKGYGNAVQAKTAELFIMAFIDTIMGS